jgi:DNA-binding transcriptional ArsR family regulator
MAPRKCRCGVCGNAESGTNGNRAVTIWGVAVFVAIADPVRRGILRVLVDGPHRVVDIQRLLADDHPISRPAVSRHLRVLAEAGLVEATETGRERHYRLERAPLADVRALLSDLGVPEASRRTRPPISESMLDALDTEVYRARRERRSAATEDAANPRAATRHDTDTRTTEEAG